MISIEFHVLPKGKVFHVTRTRDGRKYEILTYIVERIVIFGEGGECEYTGRCMDRQRAIQNGTNPYLDILNVNFGKDYFVTMEEAIEEVRRRQNHG